VGDGFGEAVSRGIHVILSVRKCADGTGGGGVADVGAGGCLYGVGEAVAESTLEIGFFCVAANHAGQRSVARFGTGGENGDRLVQMSRGGVRSAV
jgi:hypothetical protein